MNSKRNSNTWGIALTHTNEVGLVEFLSGTTSDLEKIIMLSHDETDVDTERIYEKASLNRNLSIKF